MAKVTFRTADGRIVTFTPGKSKRRSRKNPSDSVRYRSGSRVARAVDAMDRARMAAKKKAKTSAKRSTKRATKRTLKRVAAPRKALHPSSKACRRKTGKGKRTVVFADGREVTFTRKAGCNKAAKARRGKKLHAKNNLSAYSFVKGKSLTAASDLKGKRKGQVFTKAGKTYRVVSYKHPSSKKIVRYALRVKASAK